MNTKLFLLTLVCSIFAAPAAEHVGNGLKSTFSELKAINAIADVNLDKSKHEHSKKLAEPIAPPQVPAAAPPAAAPVTPPQAPAAGAPPTDAPADASTPAPAGLPELPGLSTTPEVPGTPDLPI